MWRYMDCARDSYHDEFIDFLPHFSSRALSHVSHGPNYHLYDFGSRESGLVPRCFGVNPCSHHSVCSLRRHDFPARGVYSHVEPSRFDDPHFLHHGSRSTRSNDEVLKIVKTFSGRMVKCCIPKIFITNPTLSHQPSLTLCR
jgi:hypothetical protein